MVNISKPFPKKTEISDKIEMRVMNVEEHICRNYKSLRLKENDRTHGCQDSNDHASTPDAVKVISGRDRLVTSRSTARKPVKSLKRFSSSSVSIFPFKYP